MADSFIQIAPDGSGKKIDNSQLTQDGSAVVYRQRVSIGDDTNVDNHAKVDTAGNLSTKEAQIITEVDASQTVGTTAVQAIAAGAATTWVDMENVSTGGQLIGYTYDGSTPVIGAAGTFILIPYGTKTYSSRITSAKLQVIGSAAGALVTIKYA